MGSTLRLNDVLASLDSDSSEQESTTEKTASAQGAPSRARQDLLEILARGKDGGGEKTAAEYPTSRETAATPAGDLEKIAEQVQAAEAEALVKEAHFYGSAICDGFMSRMSQYENAAGIVRDQEPEETEEKTAADVYADIEPEAFELADGLIKEAADSGVDLSGEEALEKVAQHYHSQGAQEVLEKVAEDFHEAGVQELLEKCAEDFHEAGYQDLLESMAEDFRAEGFEEALEKIAEDLYEAGEQETVDALTKVAFDQGYEDAMEKIAESAFNHGYEDMAALLDSQAA